LARKAKAGSETLEYKKISRYKLKVFENSTLGGRHTNWRTGGRKFVLFMKLN
jgi:hypothetical protein